MLPTKVTALALTECGLLEEDCRMEKGRRVWMSVWIYANNNPVLLAVHIAPTGVMCIVGRLGKELGRNQSHVGSSEMNDMYL